MLTSKTKLTLALLHDIHQSNYCHIDSFHYSAQSMILLLHQLETANLVQRIPDKPFGVPSSYKLNKNYTDITLLEVLYAIGEGINFNRENDPDFYEHYGCLARKLGVMNHVMRLYLSEMRIFDFPNEYPNQQETH